MPEPTHKSITVTLKMYDVTDGSRVLLEETPANKPMSLITGFGMLPLDALESRLLTLRPGDEYEFTLRPEEAFGAYSDDKIVDIDRQMFLTDGKLDTNRFHVGAVVPIENELRQRFLARIRSIGETAVTMDLNHELAGRTLLFAGAVLDAHDATDDELALLENMRGCGGCGGGCRGGGCGGCNHDT